MRADNRLGNRGSVVHGAAVTADVEHDLLCRESLRRVSGSVRRTRRLVGWPATATAWTCPVDASGRQARTGCPSTAACTRAMVGREGGRTVITRHPSSYWLCPPQRHLRLCCRDSVSSGRSPAASARPPMRARAGRRVRALANSNNSPASRRRNSCDRARTLLYDHGDPRRTRHVSSTRSARSRSVTHSRGCSAVVVQSHCNPMCARPRHRRPATRPRRSSAAMREVRPRIARQQRARRRPTRSRVRHDCEPSMPARPPSTRPVRVRSREGRPSQQADELVSAQRIHRSRPQRDNVRGAGLMRSGRRRGRTVVEARAGDTAVRLGIACPGVRDRVGRHVRRGRLVGRPGRVHEVAGRTACRTTAVNRRPRNPRPGRRVGVTIRR